MSCPTNRCRDIRLNRNSSLGISHQTSVCTVSVRHTHQVNVEWCHTPQISAFDAHSHEFNWTIRQERPRVVGPSWGAELMGKLHSFLQLLLLVNLWESPSNINKEHFACQDWVGVALWNKTKKERNIECIAYYFHGMSNLATCLTKVWLAQLTKHTVSILHLVFIIWLISTCFVVWIDEVLSRPPLRSLPSLSE